MMQLQFKEKYISIDEFNPVELPNFTVLTGVNGSGKSHLLGAIEQRKITIADIEEPNIVLFNYETFKLENEGAINAQQIVAEREEAWKYCQQNIKPNVQNWRSSMIGDEYAELKNSVLEKKSLFSLSSEKLTNFKKTIKKHFSGLRQDNRAQSIYSVARKLPYSIDEVEHDDFIKYYKPYNFKNNFLPNQLGKIFWDYYEKYLRNGYSEFENEKHGKSNDVLSAKEFGAIHGEKPWELINRILETFDSMQYRVNTPEGLGYFDNYQLKLMRIDKENIEVEFNSLSSGEKILMALVASIYKSSSDGNFPDILLLDEVDASLHPSMMKNMLDVIEKIFVKEGVMVILVSHSPTTIALAPEDSVYIMNKSGLNRIEKKSKQDALNILTQGFATLEQSLKLFDSVTHKFSIITEGKNTVLIKKALEFYGIADVVVIEGLEGITGKTQLKTLFDFFSKIEHSNKIIFVWDCDATDYRSLQTSNNTYAYVFPKNDSNTTAKKGIENMFAEDLFDNFKKTTHLPDGKIHYDFYESCKRDFEKFVIGRNNLNDFKSFVCLVDEIKRIKAL